MLGVDLVQNAWRGYNAALFAYGQTGAGKSHSMTGPRSDPGVLPRACDLLFHFIDTQPGDITWHVEGSYYEILNEKICDLLTKDGPNLRVRDDKVPPLTPTLTPRPRPHSSPSLQPSLLALALTPRPRPHPLSSPSNSPSTLGPWRIRGQVEPCSRRVIR